MAKGRVFSEGDHPISVIRELGNISVSIEKRGISLWTEQPDILLKLIHSAYKRRISVDLFPQSQKDIERVGAWRKRLSRFVTAPQILPIRLSKGDHIKIFQGRPTRNEMPRPKLVFEKVVLSSRDFKAEHKSE